MPAGDVEPHTLADAAQFSLSSTPLLASKFAAIGDLNLLAIGV
jgi:hypothetical protein